MENVLSYSKSVNLILEAAREYFNAAASLMDGSMDLSRYNSDKICFQERLI